MAVADNTPKVDFMWFWTSKNCLCYLWKKYSHITIVMDDPCTTPSFPRKIPETTWWLHMNVSDAFPLSTVMIKRESFVYSFEFVTELRWFSWLLMNESENDIWLQTLRAKPIKKLPVVSQIILAYSSSSCPIFVSRQHLMDHNFHNTKRWCFGTGGFSYRVDSFTGG